MFQKEIYSIRDKKYQKEWARSPDRAKQRSNRMKTRLVGSLHGSTMKANGENNGVQSIPDPRGKAKELHSQRGGNDKGKGTWDRKRPAKIKSKNF